MQAPPLCLDKSTNIWKKAQSTLTSSRWLRTEEMGKIYQVLVQGYRGEKKTIDLCNTEEQMKSMTVKQLKEKIAQKFPETAGMYLILGTVCVCVCIYCDKMKIFAF